MEGSRTIVKTSESILIKLTKLLAVLSGVYALNWSKKTPGNLILNHLDILVGLAYIIVNIFNCAKAMRINRNRFLPKILTFAFSISSLGVLLNYLIRRKASKQLHLKLEKIQKKNKDKLNLHCSFFIFPIFLLTIITRLYLSVDGLADNFNIIAHLPVYFNNFIIILECLTIEKQLHILNKGMLKLLNRKAHLKNMLRLFSKRYAQLVEMTDEMNYCHEYDYLNITLLSMLRTVVVMHRSVTTFALNSSSNTLNLNKEFILLATIIIGISFLGTFYYSCWCSSLLTEKINAFIKQLYNKEISMSSLNIFKFNLRMFCTFVENAITYIIVALQFSETNGTKNTR
ncbi:uncharacterized protein LOC106664464 isoform X2 [Cimex lectularius]|uniref:Gustatory receptor n=1 Tax=Cimex lectularius TaxID=79782 RepID=A0A8I6STQ6_CIMLE|nr:uncharacterized protein LOC106664464 isoform X2 [Cimex lectularius]